MARTKQTSMIVRAKSEYGGDLQTTRAGRAQGRPLSTRESMHLVLRSTMARGEYSFRRPKNDAAVRHILAKFSAKYGVQILSLANVGNHLHLHIRLTKRLLFAPFIRAVTGAIALAVGGTRASRLKLNRGGRLEKRRVARMSEEHEEDVCERWSAKFWDRRPFTRIVQSFRAKTNLNSYVRVNQLEGEGYSRELARDMVDVEKMFAGG